jgi:hypothetical protein
MTKTYQFHLVVISLALGLAYSIRSASAWPRFVTFGLVAGVFEFGLLVFLAWGRRVNQAVVQEFNRDIAAMTQAQARDRSFAVLERSNHVRHVGPLPDQMLPLAVREVFEAYNCATFTLGDVLKLGRSDQGFVEVGTTTDGARLLVRDQDGGLFEWAGAGVPRPDAAADYPTLYHWIAFKA